MSIVGWDGAAFGRIAPASYIYNYWTPGFKITPEGGYAVRMINHTGATSVKGTVIDVDHTYVIQEDLGQGALDEPDNWFVCGANLTVNTYEGLAPNYAAAGVLYWSMYVYSLTDHLIDFYKDPGKTELVGHATGDKNVWLDIIPDIVGGISGQIKIKDRLLGPWSSDEGFVRVPITGGVEFANLMWSGVVYESGIKNGQSMWVVVKGLADVLVSPDHNDIPAGLFLSVDPDQEGTVMPAAEIWDNTTVGKSVESAGTASMVRCLLRA